MPWDFKTVGEHARSLAAMVAIVSLPVGGAWYVFQIEGRMRTVEAQIQALATGPSNTNAASGTPQYFGVDEACNEVTKRYNEFRAKRLKPQEAAMQDLMGRLCGGGGGN